MALRYLLGLFVISILLLGRLLWPFLSILVLSFVLTGIFRPFYSFLIRRHVSPGFSSLLSCLLIVIIVFIPLTLFIGALSREAFALYQLAKSANFVVKFWEIIQNEHIVRGREFLEGFGIKFEPEGFTNTLSDFAKLVGGFIYNQASSWATNIMSFLLNFLMMIVIIFFLLRDQEHLINYINRLSPLPAEQGILLVNKFHEIAKAVLIGNGVCGIIQGVFGCMIFALFEIGPPIFWGAIMGILAFLPIFGIGLVLIPASFFLLLKGEMGAGIFLIIFYMTLSFSVEYFLKPKMVGKQVNMHTLLVFLGIMGGLSVFGFLGIIYGPLIITAFLTLSELYSTQYDRYMNSEKKV
ncbi:MAG: AI-2E family transporter [Proteobacteria bacterium]|nr:AI-2E family transporter [Desulfobulbaceae bacterium]MBU4153253.1 AI-2E family transporter [Pseudomonadota bacterium]